MGDIKKGYEWVLYIFFFFVGKEKLILNCNEYLIIFSVYNIIYLDIENVVGHKLSGTMV